MATGLLALLDDVAAIAKVAAASLDDAAAQAITVGKGAAGIVIDDAAVTPRYVTGFAADRELPIIGRIALGSLKNKLLILLPGALLLSWLAPWSITILLVIGGAYLCFEGYEKVHTLVTHEDHSEASLAGVENTAKDTKALEDEKVAGAIRTDFILSAEIMALSLAAITSTDPIQRAVILALVGILVTAGVYGFVALIVKADDIGLALAKNARTKALRTFGRLLVTGTPVVLRVLSIVGLLAMLWVGGGILLHGAEAAGFHAVPEMLHQFSGRVAALAGPVGGFFGWGIEAAVAGCLGLAVGWLVALALTPFAKRG